MLSNIGIIVGRFQVAELHEAHIALINLAVENSDEIIIYLGENKDIKNSPRDPLSFEQRAFMIWDTYREINPLAKIRIGPIYDAHDDKVWVERLDWEILKSIRSDNIVRLYGGRDSFLEIYDGLWKDNAIKVPHMGVSGSDIRAEIARKRTGFTKDFREGVIWARANRFDNVHPTVDVAIFHEGYEMILLGRKKDKTTWCLIGGFADPESETYEDDAQREANEEASVAIDNIVYLGSGKIDDWRYAKEKDCIKSLLFAGTTWNEGLAGDDIEEIKWFWPHEVVGPDGFALENIAPNHKKFVEKAMLYADAMRFEPSVSVDAYGTAKGNLGED